MTDNALRTEAECIVESVLKHHLPIQFEDDRVMCMCHATGNDAIFDGPVFHRQHVAALVMRWLDQGEREPSPWDDESGGDRSHDERDG